MIDGARLRHAATPEFMTETPNRASQPGSNQDLLADVLQRIQLASAVFLRGEFTAPWGFTSTDAATLCAIVQPGARNLVLFHVAVEGRFRIQLASGESAQAEAGDAVVLPYCDQHTMGHPPQAQPVPIATLVPMPPWTEMPVVRHGGGGEPTRILCGYLHCDDLLFNPLLRALPRLIHVRPSTPQAAQWRQASLRYVAEQARQGENAMLARLPGLVLADCLAQYARDLPAHQRGWLAALNDAVLGRALMLLHARPSDAWTVDDLAGKCAVSRSVLAERFSQSLGVSPMRYLAQWRMQLAANLLRDQPGLGLAQVADQVGYESEAAFSRAFKRHVGRAPANWARN
ncbi:AraC family transcriptional regulator [Ramlibacter albus]|uniref:AraC family transcriptional regulator n=1 Tax=Ramlibacter albus TaxID=2079448 RepID=A0A923S3K3_9BURK|nr:AraC family transcriptional regulator [Ramlibacter albus]MBC5763207.1 AraC family transcriptional regulator [Ramlibacter albus]